MSKPHFGRDAALYALSGLATKLIGALLLPIITRLLTPAEYGAIDLIVLTMSVGLECIILGTDYVLALYYHDEAAQQRQLIGTLLLSRIILGLAVAIVGFGFAGLLTTSMGISNARTVILLACITLPATAMVNNWLMILRQEGRSGLLLGISIGKVFFTALLTVGLIYGLQNPLQGYFSAFLLVDYVLAFGLTWSFRHKIGRPLWSIAQPLFTKGIAFFPRSVYFIAMSLVARQVLLWWSSLEEVGYYAAAVKVSYIIWIAISASSQAWLAYSMSIARQPDAHTLYAQYLEQYVIIVGFLTVCIGLFAPEILFLLTTSDYLPAARVVGWQTLSLMAVGALVIVTTGLNIIKETAIVGRTTMLMACINIGLVFALVPSLGSLGVALAAALDQGLVVCMLYHIAQKKYPLPFRGKHILFWLSLIVLCLIITTFLPSVVTLEVVLLKLGILGSYMLTLFFAGAHHVVQVHKLIQTLRTKVHILPLTHKSKDV